MLVMKYMVVIEEGPVGFGAYLPDLPGCVAAADTRDEVVKLIGEAVDIHLQAMKEDGDEIPLPTSSAELVEVAA